MTASLTYLSLFSGIGGLDLGLDRAGLTCVGQVERDPYCRSVLTTHWPEVPKHDDVRTAPSWWFARPRPVIRLVAGGFPCQPFGRGGLRLGTSDPRWGWPLFYDLVRAVRPEYVLVENVPGLLDHADAFGTVLGDLAALGFDAEWSLLSACALGAPHTRERLFVLAYPAGKRLVQRGGIQRPPHRDPKRHVHHWAAQPEPHRVADGVPRRVDRNRALGNAVVPAVGEFIGRLIVASAGQVTAP
ncbi:DNA cytosine methyltransferase [Micromonospora luteifusca]|uniref:DNA cytosine methyltransferase n=1 Tax=Micromonospora luteifusca TaxID=709860 RepID=UPI0033BCAA72